MSNAIDTKLELISPWKGQEVMEVRGRRAKCRRTCELCGKHRSKYRKICPICNRLVAPGGAEVNNKLCWFDMFSHCRKCHAVVVFLKVQWHRKQSISENSERKALTERSDIISYSDFPPEVQFHIMLYVLSPADFSQAKYRMTRWLGEGEEENEHLYLHKT